MILSPRRIWNWCLRFRYRCGYGVHSPSDFFLVTSVIYENDPYYAYDTLSAKEFAIFLPHYRPKVNRLLFRLVNYYQPNTLIEVGVGDGSSISYMRAANLKMCSTALKGRELQMMVGRLQKTLEEYKTVSFLHIGHTPYYKEAFEQALPYVDSHSLFIVGGIYKSKEKRAWWRQIKEDDRVGITFDLYDVGLLFFDKKRYKQHYKINFL
ncbi:MAG: hypothetical protein ACRCZY_01540 [Phocaeicola sp.]